MDFLRPPFVVLKKVMFFVVFVWEGEGSLQHDVREMHSMIPCDRAPSQAFSSNDWEGGSTRPLPLPIGKLSVSCSFERVSLLFPSNETIIQTETRVIDVLILKSTTGYTHMQTDYNFTIYVHL